MPQFNLAEAVNFGLPSWEPHGLHAVQRYRAFNKLPVFSHDELLMSIASSDTFVMHFHWYAPR
jgi:histone demethylase JARID1